MAVRSFLWCLQRGKRSVDISSNLSQRLNQAQSISCRMTPLPLSWQCSTHIKRTWLCLCRAVGQNQTLNRDWQHLLHPLFTLIWRFSMISCQTTAWIGVHVCYRLPPLGTTDLLLLMLLLFDWIWSTFLYNSFISALVANICHSLIAAESWKAV